MSVYKAINAVQADLAKAGIAKADENKFDNYKFRGIDAVYNSLAPLLAKHCLLVLPRMLTRTCEERQSQKGGALFYVTVEAEFDFVSAEDGSKHTVKTFGEAMDRGDKATNKAMSAAYKYACFQAFCIPTEGDNDADATSHEVAPAKPSTQKPDGIKPTAGAGEGLSDERKAIVEETALFLIDSHENGKDTDAIRVWYAEDTFLDNDERVYCWKLLERHSKLRATIKANKPENK